MSTTAFTYTISDDCRAEDTTVLSDEKAFESLFKTYYAKLSFFANKFVNDLQVSEEIVSDTFTGLWEQRKSLEITTSMNAYLYRMVQNRCLNYLKHKKVESEYVNYLAKHNMLTEIPASAQNPYFQKELEEQVQNAIAALPEKCREVFKMSRFEQLKNKEIAEQLNVSPKTVERHMTIALDKLRHCLKHLFIAR
ncbi:RNA polymerase sigma-70 factor [Paradesertivirga mongoliensis]|uniref:RNA polymerase sigma-70 factor n=1 Tax=Paradesertivirga mongoliensis TaxID=2100740 RepID=A0ABW4ZSR7_9SPHI|nr:RNA polymerase sigma-70 factor [Pedobacter mongoliensis]